DGSGCEYTGRSNVATTAPARGGESGRPAYLPFHPGGSSIMDRMALVLLFLAWPLSVRAQSDAAPQTTPHASAGADSVKIVAGPRYRAGWLHRFFFGSHYRDLWTTPLEVEKLDLDTVAGGLLPSKRGGGEQTKSLRFKGADGREYAF